jgi:predicted SAM-dependent methyltransferase
LEYLNLGCGAIYHDDWINIDYTSNSQFVLEYDLTKGIPKEDLSVDVVYHSHILEHFTKQQAVQFLKECFRVLKNNGIIRIVVPDLQFSVKEYMHSYNNLKLEKNSFNHNRYDWSVIELIDQMTRTYSGGEVMHFLKQPVIHIENELEKRWGIGCLNYRNHLLSSRNEEKTHSFKEKVKLYIFKLLGYSEFDYNYLNFHKIGELHKWMYDDLSITTLLKETGFSSVKIISNPLESRISNWEKYSFLDCENNLLRKPDSLIIEASKFI